jgi:hypothetical protein
MQIGSRLLLVLAGVLLLCAATAWLLTGTNRGWTKTIVPHKLLDEVTGIEGVTYERRFVPGLDFLAAAVLGSGVLAGVSFFLKHPNPKAHSPDTK